MNQTFCKRLKEMRKEAEKTQDEMANFLKVKRSTYGEYERGKITPPIDKLSRLAKYFDVSVDYLMGREIKFEENYSDDQSWKSEVTTEKIGTKLKQMRLMYNISLVEMSEDMSISVQTLKKYENGTLEIPHQVLKAYAKYFNVDMDKLTHIDVSNEEMNTKSSFISDNPELAKRVERWNKEIGYTNMTNEEVEKIIEYAKFLLFIRKDK